MPDFEYEPDTFHLVFDDPKYKDLEVEAQELPIGGVLAIMSISDGTSVQMERVAELVEAFAGALVSWNITKKGEPVPCTAEGLMSLGTRFVLPMVQAWFAAVMGVDAPLPEDSDSGATALEESIPMASL